MTSDDDMGVRHCCEKARLKYLRRSTGSGAVHAQQLQSGRYQHFRNMFAEESLDYFHWLRSFNLMSRC